MGIRRIHIILLLGLLSSRICAQDTLKIWLALPFCAEVSPKEMKAKKLYGVQKASVDYYVGALMAVDSLKTLGIPIYLEVKDTRKDSATTVRIFKTLKPGMVDVVIGPVNKKPLLIANKYTSQAGILQVCPVADATFPKGAKEIIYFESDLGTWGQEMAYYLDSVHRKNAYYILVHDASETDKVFSQNWKRMRDSLKFEMSEIPLSAMPDVAEHFQKDRLNILIFPSIQEDKINKFTGALRMAWKESVQVLGLGNWLELKNVDFEKANRFTLTMIMGKEIDYKSAQLTLFRDAYRSKYMGEPNDLSVMGFQQVFYLGMIGKESILKRHFPEKDILWGSCQLHYDYSLKMAFPSMVSLTQFNQWEQKVIFYLTKRQPR